MVFYDNGIRNAIVNDFRLPPLRNDMGLLWENYLIGERIKTNAYSGKNVQYYFWRNYNQQEVDLIEFENGEISAYEFKYPPTKKVKVPPAFETAYPDAMFTTISKDNYLIGLQYKDTNKRYNIHKSCNAEDNECTIWLDPRLLQLGY